MDVEICQVFGHLAFSGAELIRGWLNGFLSKVNLIERKDSVTNVMRFAGKNVNVTVVSFMNEQSSADIDATSNTDHTCSACIKLIVRLCISKIIHSIEKL